MGHRESILELASIFSPQNDARPTVLLGAGASFSSGVPVAAEGVKRMARRVFAERVLGGRTPPEHVKTSEWRAWLTEQPWFIPGEENLADNFPLAVKHLLQPQAYRQTVLLDLITPSEGISRGYSALSELVLRGLAGTILTTNFDICLPRALNAKRPHIRHVAEVWRQPQDIREFDIFRRAQIVWLHGKAEQYTDKNLVEEVSQLDARLVSLLFPLMQSTPLVVVGYRGAEPSIMTSLLGDTGDLAFRKGIFWCHRGGDLHPNVIALKDRLKGNFRLLDIDGFDELFADLDVVLARQQRALGPPVAEEKPDFDDVAVQNATVADLDLDLALHTALQYANKLGLPEVTASTLKSFLRELGLLKSLDGIERPSHAAILLFGRDPQRFLPHAVITTTIDGKNRKVISGNLLNQRTALLDWMAQKEVNPVLKVKGRTKHEERPAYHARAILELFTNLLVHRDYADDRPATIEVESRRRISFTNPGRLSPHMISGLTLDPAGIFEPVRELTSPQNRALCDIFYGISAMERAGTGLSDVLKFARESDGAAVFRLPPGGVDFRAEIYQPEASGKFAAVARDTRPVGTYIINVLPFASLPAEVGRVQVKGTLRQIAESVPLRELGTVMLRGDELWSFAPIPLMASILKPVTTEARVRATEREELEADADLARVFSWLLRKHFESHLHGLKEHGLIIEPDRRSDHRAYFVGLNKGPRKFVYDFPARKNIEREVVKKRAEPPKIWFENEGIAYGITRIGTTWGIRIKPFYMFTGPDAETPLPSYARTAKATRRMRFDRNQSVESDLTFWARFLAQGKPVINIGRGPVDDLLVEGAFLTLDVPEEGLIDDADSDQDQMPA